MTNRNHNYNILMSDKKRGSLSYNSECENSMLSNKYLNDRMNSLTT